MSTDLGPDRPFPGLRPYQPADHAWFFGREEQILSLYRLLDRGRLVTVVGSSGSGKSSVVKAGLLPLLHQETTPDGKDRWRCWDLRPGDTPIARLADALASQPAAEHDEQALAAYGGRRQRLDFLLRKSSFGLHDTLNEIECSPGATPLILVDQFEELFRLADLPGSEAERIARRQEAAAFVRLLLEATQEGGSRLRVILTVRSDYLGDCARFHGLPEAVTASQFLIPSLTRSQREEVIREPIRMAGGKISDDLVERLLNDSTEELDQLPILQHALMRTWNQAGEGHSLTLADYEAVGGMSAAISQHADLLLKEPELRPRGQAVEQVFRALAELDRHGRAIRRPLRFDQLVAETGVDTQDVQAVVDRFRRDDCSFLVPSFVEGRPLVPEDIIDVCHEALIRRWLRMTRETNGLRAGWLADEAADGRTYVAMMETARGARPDRPALLSLEQVEGRVAWWRSRPRTASWAERYGGCFETVTKLLSDSEAAFAASRKEQEEKALEEAERKRRLAAEEEGRKARREVLIRTQGAAFIGVSLMAAAMNLGLVYRTPPFSWPVLITVVLANYAIFFISPGSEGIPSKTGSVKQLSLGQTVWSYYLADLIALVYLIWYSGGLVTSPFTVFLLLLPMNGILLEEAYDKVERYFGGVILAAVGLALAQVKWGHPAPLASPSRVAFAQIILLTIAFGTALVGYQRLDQQRQNSQRS